MGVLILGALVCYKAKINMTEMGKLLVYLYNCNLLDNKAEIDF